MKWLPTDKWGKLRSFTEVMCLAALLIHLSMNGGIWNAIREAPSKLKMIMYTFVLPPADFRTDFFGLVYEGRSGNILDDLILVYGAQEKPELFLLRDVALAMGTRDLVFYDLGANVGQHTLFMSKYAKRIDAFEPYPPVLKRLRNNVAINQLATVHIHAVGLGDENGSIPYFEPLDYNLGGGGFVHNPENGDRPIEKLSLVIGDDYAKKQKLPDPDLVKIDIEGYEKPAILGFSQTLGRSRPVILVEITPGYPTSFRDVMDLLANLPPDYAIAALCEADQQTGSYRLCPYESDKFWTHGPANLILYPKERASILPFSGRAAAQ